MRRAERGLEVTVDGRSFMADLVRAGSGGSLLVGQPNGAMRSYDVAVDEQPVGTTVYVNGRAIPVMMNGASARFGRRGSADEK